MRSMLKTVLLGSLLCFSASGFAQTAERAPLADAEGQIQELNFARSTMVVNGYAYEVDKNVRVRISNSFGAFTMLQEGMLIEYSFLRFDDGVRRITEINQVSQVEEF